MNAGMERSVIRLAGYCQDDYDVSVKREYKTVLF